MAPGLIPRGAVTAIAGVVIAVWGVAQVADAFVDGYDAPAEIHLAVMLVLGALFGLRKDGDDDRPTPEPAPAPAAPAPPAVPVPPPELPEPPGPGRESAADMIARLQRERRERP